MMNDGARASWVREELKELPCGEVLDESAWKRFDTDGRLFWSMNTQAIYEEACRIIEAHKS
jgi:RNA binding exosome subunit